MLTGFLCSGELSLIMEKGSLVVSLFGTEGKGAYDQQVASQREP
jgi:hypothetical protein